MPTEQEMQQHGTGALRSPDDYRYISVEHLAGAAPVVEVQPASFHIDFSQVPDLYQRKIGACTSHAAAEIRIHRELRLTGQIKRLSPRFNYTMCKIEDGISDLTEQGTFPVMPFKVGTKYGWATEVIVANDTTLAFDDYIYHRDIRNIPEGAFAEAAQNKIPGYAQVGGFNSISEAQIKQGIQHSFDGVKVCLPIGAEWWTAADGRVSWASVDILPIRKMVEAVSGHDVTITGWETEDGTGRCKIYFRNHWSEAWADKDNGWFYFDQHKLSEAWVISEIPDPILAIVKSLPSQKDFTHNWAVDLAPGAQGPDVQALQIALKIVGTFPFNQPVTSYFGNITKAAVIAFQKEYNVASADAILVADGAFGPKSRATLNKLFNH